MPDRYPVGGEGGGMPRSGQGWLVGKVAVFGVFYTLGLWIIACVVIAWSSVPNPLRSPFVFSLTVKQLAGISVLTAIFGASQAAILFVEGRKRRTCLPCLRYGALPQAGVVCAAAGIAGMALLAAGVLGIVVFLEWLPDLPGRVLGVLLGVVGLMLTAFLGLPLWPLYLGTFLLLRKTGPGDEVS